jgi:hypothetical protein
MVEITVVSVFVSVRSSAECNGVHVVKSSEYSTKKLMLLGFWFVDEPAETAMVAVTDMGGENALPKV